MDPQTQKLLAPFHFGSIDDGSRLAVEREMLADPEVLIEYFDLKRTYESARGLPQQPSPRLWKRLDRPWLGHGKTVLAWSFRIAIAASLVVLTFRWIHGTSAPENKPSVEKQFLFDSGSELSANSNVL